jgi:hypothetical protein
MRRIMVPLVVVASLLIGSLAVGAIAQDRGRTLAQRVSALEASAERQRRAIDSLREENAEQRRQIRRLLRFRTDTNERLAVLGRRTTKLNGHGVYSGPVDNGQVQLGSEPAECAGEIAEWNGAGTSLGCVPPA